MAAAGMAKKKGAKNKATRKQIPVVWYHTEGHPDFHRVTDSADKVDYPKLTDIIRAAALCVWRLANVRDY